MLTETISGKCPCCGYDKMMQRYGSMGYFQMDFCPNCGFGYGTNHHELESHHHEAGIGWAVHTLACCHKSVGNFQDDPCVVRTNENGIQGVKPNGGKTKEEKAYDAIAKELEALPEIEVRRRLFEWCEGQERADDIPETVFKYSQEDVQTYLATNPVIFKVIFTQDKANEVFNSDLGQQVDSLFTTSDGEVFIRRKEAVAHTNAMANATGNQQYVDTTIKEWFRQV